MFAHDGGFGGDPASPRGTVGFPAKLRFLFKPSRYKVLYGGRGSGKSWGVARALLLQGMQLPKRILCAREFQNSLDESVHQLLSSQIREMGLEGFYKIQNAVITGDNGTEFIFKGLRHNADSVKSFESIDVVWWEEAQTASKKSLDILIPTIRKAGSELIFTLNPDLETDEIYQRFIVNPPAGAVVEKVNWSDNPWFPEVLRSEMGYLKGRDPDAWSHVWEGNCRQTLEGAVYAKELREMTLAGRACKVPYDMTKPVHAFFDIGWSDSTSIWLAQAVGLEYRILEYIEDRQRAVEHYARLLKSLPYVLGDIWLPHDAQSTNIAAGGRTVEGQLKSLGFKVRITPRLSVADGINAARTIFSSCYFDQIGCSDGLNQLRRYRYDVDEATGQFSKKPLHDESSHAADAFRYLAVSLKEKRTENVVNLKTAAARMKKQSHYLGQSAHGGGWMGA
jgi:phage terminase large subunit